MKATITAGSLQLDMNLLEAAELYGRLKDNDPVKAVLKNALAPTDSVNVVHLVKTWPWSGSWFPESECFQELKGQVPENQHDELRALIEKRAKQHNAHRWNNP